MFPGWERVWEGTAQSLRSWRPRLSTLIPQLHRGALELRYPPRADAQTLSSIKVALAGTPFQRSQASGEGRALSTTEIFPRSWGYRQVRMSEDNTPSYLTAQLLSVLRMPLLDIRQGQVGQMGNCWDRAHIRPRVRLPTDCSGSQWRYLLGLRPLATVAPS